MIIKISYIQIPICNFQNFDCLGDIIYTRYTLKIIIIFIKQRNTMKIDFPNQKTLQK